MSSETQDSANGNGAHEYIGKDFGSDDALKRIRTAGSISISPELFEKLYLSPERKVKGKLCDISHLISP